ncbi:MAG: type II secretion system minor pseudopilin GspJ [Gammaproteobacteria bacterium]|nr:type II secretion system minor pseudopilin GspJ [Gammaproteobacteria bacterium]
MMFQQGVRYRGFTLLELLVSLAIFSLIAAMAYGGLHTVLQNRNSTDRHAQAMQRMQLLYRAMQRDIEQIVGRPVRNEFGDSTPAILVNDRGFIELTRAGWSNPLGRPRSTLQRVAWFVRDEELIRRYWLVLDRAQDSPPLDLVIMDKVEEFSVRLMDDQKKWHSQWPPQSLTQRSSAVKIIVAEVEIKLLQQERINWLFQVP